MTKSLTKKSPSKGFAHGPGSGLGEKSKTILEMLQKGKPRNRLDIEMAMGCRAIETITRLVRLNFIRKSTYGSGGGCFEITRHGREAMGEVLFSPPPAYAPICNATMTKPYDPSIHNTSRIGVARA